MKLMPSSPHGHQAWLPTLLGLIAIGLWSTTIACSRGMAERLGMFTGAALAYLIAGLIGCAVMAASGRLRGGLRTADRRYLWGCGLLMVLYTALLYAAVGLAQNREQVIAVTVANYLWPSLTLLFSVPILGWRARGWVLGLGSALALTGVALMLGAGTSNSPDAAARGTATATMLALAAAVAWGLYSTLSRRWASSSSSGAMPVFLLATGLTLLVLRWVLGEQSVWTFRGVAEAAYVAIFPTLLAYTFWDAAARRGNLALVAPASYCTPLLSVWISSLYLGISLHPVQWAASGLVVLGAVVCKAAVRE